MLNKTSGVSVLMLTAFAVLVWIGTKMLDWAVRHGSLTVPMAAVVWAAGSVVLAYIMTVAWDIWVDSLYEEKALRITHLEIPGRGRVPIQYYTNRDWEKGR